MSKFFAVVGPSGVGKTSIVKRVAKSMDMRIGVSCTTREKREDEEDGIHYHFITQWDYDHYVQWSDFIEHNEHFGASYGLLWSEWDAAQKQQRDLIVVLDVDGLKQAAKKIPGIVGIFIAPGDTTELVDRMTLRGDSEFQIAQRIKRTSWEMEHMHNPEYQYIVYNPNGALRQAIEQVETIVMHERVEAA